LWIAGQQKLPPRPAPTVGQHSTEILREAGYSAAEIRALQEAGIIG
jgi:crotonobetainyl-CoA:carnitine CoA-transferase CaiB-like acyl-CoA transferase